jgi:hypothetical protein
MQITSPTEIAVLLTLGAMVLLAVTSLLVCLQRPGPSMQPVALRTQDRAQPDEDNRL